MGAFFAEAGRVGVTVRSMLPEDKEAARRALNECGNFSQDEVAVALDMVEAGLNGDYSILAATIDSHLCGYICAGKASLTLSTWYIYWICVHPGSQGIGVGQILQRHIETLVRDAGGHRIVLETSGRSGYKRARRFYEQAGYAIVGRIPDFYRQGDDCVMYCKVLSEAR